MRFLEREAFLFGCVSDGLWNFLIRLGVGEKNGPGHDEGACCAGYEGM